MSSIISKIFYKLLFPVRRGKHALIAAAVKLIIFKLPVFFKLLARGRKTSAVVLIIKTDAIGDYILFRNYLEVVRNSDRFRNHRIDVLANPVWQDVALKYDKPFVDNFIFKKKDKLLSRPFKLFGLAWQLFFKNYAVVLQPSYTRILINDAFAAFTAASEIIGFESNTEGISADLKIKTDKFYTQLIPLVNTIKFEGDKFRIFFETVLKQHIQVSSSISHSHAQKSGVIIFPGAGVTRRRWDAVNFLTLINLILNHSQHAVYIAGGTMEQEIASYLINQSNSDRVINITGQQALPALIETIASSLLVISNETGAIHIAAATATNSVCILGGGHFERFAPYPDTYPNRPVCVYEEMECYSCNWNCIYPVAEGEVYPCIKIIGPQQVWNTIKQMLSIKESNLHAS